MTPASSVDNDLPRSILIIEDDADIAEILRMNLRDEGYVVDWSDNGEAGLAQLAARRYDALILDLMLPGMDGLDICRRVRTMPHYTPIIIISAKSAEAQRVLGLELGADDYITKPFSLLEVIARVRALFRRVEALGKTARMASGFIELGALNIDPVAREARLKGTPLNLTAREFDLLFFFARQPGRVFSRMDLLTQVWGYSHEGYEHTVNTHINRLRTKMEVNPAKPEYILTVWGVGYKFAVPEEAHTP